MDAAKNMPDNRHAALRAWAALAGVLLGLWGLCAWVQKTPEPAGSDAPAESFSEARAMVVVRKLADEIGPHPIGSLAGAAAAEYLATELRKLPRLEVEVQDAAGNNRMAVWTGINFHYRVRNVLARLPGRRADAILINAHYDSPAEAPGASDNGVGTAAALEAMRALAAGPQLEQTVILSLNGGEEAGSVGAAGFLQHRWAKGVRAFVDLDGSGAGKAALVLSSRRVPALLHAYARATRSPQASVFAADLAQSGLVMFSGDFEPLTRAGLPGLDFAALGDTWGVHTHLDVSARLAPGTLQYMGNTLLSVTSELAREPPTFNVMPDRTVYYDLLGQTTLVYSMLTARVLAGLALALLAWAIGLLLRRGEVTARQLLRSTGWTVAAIFFGLVSSLFVALLLGILLQRPHGFFAMPILAVPTFVGAGLCGVLAVHSLWRRRALASGMSAESSSVAVFAAGLLLWGLILSLCSAASVGLGYLALWWVAPSALALGSGLLFPRWRAVLWGVSLFVGAASFIHLALPMVPAIVGMSGMVPVPPPADVKLAVMLWLLVVFPVTLCGVAEVHRAGRLRRALLVCAVITGAGILATAAHAPYSSTRPKRLLATHAQKDGQAALLLMSFDVLPLAPALASIPEAQPVSESEPWPNSLMPPGWMPPYSHKLPATPLSVPPPRLEVISQSADKQSGIRTVKLRLHASGWLTGLDIPAERLVGWSLGDPLPQPSEGLHAISAMFYAPHPDGEELTLMLRGAAPVEIILRQNHAPGKTSELIELRRRLPDWTTINAGLLHVVKTQI